jgi:hypothetical protein
VKLRGGREEGQRKSAEVRAWGNEGTGDGRRREKRGERGNQNWNGGYFVVVHCFTIY